MQTHIHIERDIEIHTFTESGRKKKSLSHARQTHKDKIGTPHHIKDTDTHLPISLLVSELLPDLSAAEATSHPISNVHQMMVDQPQNHKHHQCSVHTVDSCLQHTHKHTKKQQHTQNKQTLPPPGLLVGGGACNRMPTGADSDWPPLLAMDSAMV